MDVSTSMFTIGRFSEKQKNVIRTITFGNVLEWYDIYSYGIQAPSLAKHFFNFLPEGSSLLCAFLLFGMGSIIRPFSVLLLGKIADHNLPGGMGFFTKLAHLIGAGRKPTFLFSIILTTSAIFLTGCLGTYNSWGIAAPILLVLLRIITSIGLSGEYTGAMCYLYENSYPSNARSVTSRIGVGNQLGGILGILEPLTLGLCVSQQFIQAYGWRISFWIGAVIGVVIIFLRAKLSETPLYKAIEEKNKFDHETSYEIIKVNAKKILLGIGFGLVNASTYYFMAIYLPTFLVGTIEINAVISNYVSLVILIISTALIPMFGWIGDRCSNKILLFSSVALILILLLPVYYAIIEKNFIALSIVGVIYIFPVSCISALLGFQLPRLFRTDIRFTGVGFSWNVADAVMGGLTPVVLTLLHMLISFPGSLCVFIILTGLVSMFCYTKITE